VCIAKFFYENLLLITNCRLTKLQQLFGFPNSALKFISKLLGTFKYSSPIKISRDALKLMSLVFIFVASNYDKICKQKVDENIVVLKRLYRVDCGITKGQFDDLLGNFQV